MINLKQVLRQTLAPYGKWSMKRIQVFVAFNTAVGMAIITLFGVAIDHGVFGSLLAYGGGVTAASEISKKFESKQPPKH